MFIILPAMLQYNRVSGMHGYNQLRNIPCQHRLANASIVRHAYHGIIGKKRYLRYRSGAKYYTTLIIAPANISVLNDLYACFIVHLIAVGRF
jgi:hypothetical protein